MERSTTASAMERLLTSHEVGALLQVNPTTVSKWVNEGRINAFRTPGGHRRIRVGDLMIFLQAHKMPIPQSLQSAGRRRLLIVDDDKRYVTALCRRLKPYATLLEVSIATNGIDALVQVGQFQPNVILLDYVMPEVDGLEVCRRLRQNPKTKDVSVILVSGDVHALEERARKAGATRCLAKPVDVKALLDELGVSQAPTQPFDWP